ncbi:MAG: acetolactate decarboxylase [Deltaproteobacteria bacterium]|nr:acetolactate decarboxylase [Deltaproteobacteria bacterium]
MKNCLVKIVFVVILLSIVSCSTAYRNTVTQISTIDAILAGAYDGAMTLCELATYGNFGIGTFDKLDGEMILLDGTFFQIKGNGIVFIPETTLKTPFASVVQFEKDRTIKLPAGINYMAFKNIVDEKVPTMNVFCAVKVTGTFRTMKTRSVPAQKKPYPPLTEVTKHQAVFDLENVSGTIVGFRSPAYVQGINVPGYHMHFISDDFSSGGHILAFELEAGTADIDICNRFLMILPEGTHAFNRINLGIDRSKDLDKAERQVH